MGKAPRIVRDIRRRKVVVEPPPFEEHPWGTVVGEDDEKVFIEKGAMGSLVRHCEQQSEKGIEAMGFLTGGVFSWERREYTVARDVVTTGLEASAVSVRFDRNGFPGLFDSLDALGYDYILVGWYHSHPGYGCFLSATDMETQRTGFSEGHQFALVVDPVKKEMKAFRGSGEDCRELAIGVYLEQEWPWPGKKR